MFITSGSVDDVVVSQNGANGPESHVIMFCRYQSVVAPRGCFSLNLNVAGLQKLSFFIATEIQATFGPQY